jgi:hypothetical protein
VVDEAGETFLPGGGETADYWRGYHAGLAARDRPGLTAEDVLIAARKAGIDWWGTKDGGVTFTKPAEAQQREGAGE